jgi:hypothetical protein
MDGSDGVPCLVIPKWSIFVHQTTVYFRRERERERERETYEQTYIVRPVDRLVDKPDRYAVPTSNTLGVLAIGLSNSESYAAALIASQTARRRAIRMFFANYRSPRSP